MKILLSDDERMVRLGLISMLDELYPGEHTYREAKNGREMLGVAAEFLPDVAFVDIRMPLMDGLTALEECRKFSPDTQYLILTGHSDFEYARRSIRIGALDYLLKPVSLEVLRGAIEEASARLRDRRRKNNSIFSHHIVAAYHKGETDGQGGELNLSPAIRKLHIALFVPDCTSREECLRRCGELSDTLRARLDGSPGFYYALFNAAQDRLCLVSTEEPPGLRALLAEMSGCVTCIGARGIPVGEFCDCCRRLELAVSTRMFCGCGRFTLWNAPLGEKLERLAPFADDMRDLCEAFAHREELNYRETLRRMETKPYRELYALVEQDSLGRYLGAAMGCAVPTGSFSELCAGLRQCADRMYRCGKQKTQPNEIDWVKSYIQENYMNDIDVASIARLMGISSNYLSRIFHERVGCKFIDYLTQVRVTNAKRLFSQEPGITVCRAAGLVGYISVRHFSKIFARLVGCTPSEYQVRMTKGR